MEIYFIFPVLVCLCTVLKQTVGSGVKPVVLQANRDNMKFSAESLKPQQIHISFGDTSRDIIIMWATRSDDASYVDYHSGDRQSAITVKGLTVRFETTNDNGAKYLHRVALVGLVPESKYFYHVRGESKETLSDQFSFTIPPVLAGKPHTFMVYGNLGLESLDINFLLQEALDEKYEAIFHVGDIAYDLNRGDGQFGDKFLRQIEKAAARKPYMTAPGDHERFDDFLHYRYRFSMPSLPWPMPSGNLWYSIDIGFIHFIVFSSEVFFHDEVNVEPMLDWLRDDLEKVNRRRSAKPWVIALGHKPMYCSTDNINEDCKIEKSVVRAYLEDIFYAGGVDLILSGHQPYYERTWPVYKKKATQYNYREPAAPVHISIGSMGAAYTLAKSSNTGGQWSAFVLSDKGKESFGKLRIYNATHLYWEVRECINNRLVDELWIIQPFHRPFNQPRVILPNPLGEMGQRWLQEASEAPFGLESFLGISGNHYGDDYQTKLTVLFFVFVLCVLGLIARKKVLHFLRICFVKKTEPCKKINSGINSVVNSA